jgi:superfamily I DNA/RNA helicase
VQDVNRLQADLMLALQPDGRGLTAVGDDAQSIYAFRGADVRHILDLPRRFDPPARVLTLQRNYRSTPQVLDASNAVIALAAERFAKTLWTDRAAACRPGCTRWPTKPPRHAAWPTRCWPSAKPASCCGARRCCSALPRTVRRWNWS